MSIRFRTEIIPPAISQKIKPTASVALFGSCFANHIGQKLLETKFSTLVNPLGNIFNPISLAHNIHHYVIKGQRVIMEDLWEKDGIIMHKDFHSIHNQLSKEAYLLNINKVLQSAEKKLTESSHLILTFGTAWAYREKKSKQLVSNCHKMETFLFTKELLSIGNMLETVGPVLEEVNSQIILTVSPVRHWKDGAVENSRSKARLIELSHLLMEAYPHCHYFPAYELLIDDLRDYRYYTEDLLHPNNSAVQYIWEKFKEAAFDDASMVFSKKNEQLHTALQHRPFNPDSIGFRQFCKTQLAKTQALTLEYPGIDYQKETDYFRQYLSES